MRRRLLIGVALVAALLATACNANKKTSGNGGSTAKATSGGTLRVLVASSELDFDPAKSQNLGTSAIHLILRGLTTWKESETAAPVVVPDLATTTGDPSDGGKTWTYHLKSGLFYADGKPITSQDIKYGVERSFAPELAGGLAYHKTLLQGAAQYKGPYSGKELSSIETPDAKTIVFHLNNPFGDWPWIVSMPAFAPVPKASDTKPATYGQHPVASGPYQVSSFDQGKQVVLKRNPKWSKSTDSVRTAGPNSFVFELGLDDQVVNKRLIADRGDDQYAVSTGTSVQAPLLPQVQGKPDVNSRMVVSTSGALTYLALNTQRKPLSNPAVRKAIEYAVDKTAFQIAAGGSKVGGGIASTLITPGLNGYQNYNLYPTKSPSGDPAKAKSMLTAAGFPKGLTLTLLTSNDSAQVSEGQAIQAGLRRAGITVKLRSEESTAASADMTGNNPTYDLAISSWLADFPSAAGAIQPLFASDQIGNQNYNISRYKVPEVDSAITAALGTTDAKSASAKWAALDKRIMQDAPVVPLLYAHNAFLHGSKVANFFIPPYPPYVNTLVVGTAK
jgi:peptide/nickel transport system substrate-binding protein